ncbi:MAG: phytanoyl-CoA dioxygenase family protein [Chloroflexota bacterium]
MPTSSQIQQFQQEGYALVHNLFSAEEVSFCKHHFMALRAEGEKPGDFAGVDTGNEALNKADPLQEYPRMIHMHRWDDTTRKWLLDQRLRDCLNAFLGRDPYAVQTMLYYKPPGSRGQALHQDQYYLRAQPGTCVAAWLALDPSDETNGCLQVVPNSGGLPILCTTPADKTQSFTDIAVPLPKGVQSQSMIMDAGDVLFFNGTVIHGSHPNTTEDRFRRSLIAHYVTGESEQLTKYDQPVLTMDGEEKWLTFSEEGGACGVWVEQNGEPVVEIVDSEALTYRAGELDSREVRYSTSG